MKKPAPSSLPETARSSFITSSLSAPPPEMMLLFPPEFHQQTATLHDLSFGMGNATMMPMFDSVSGMFVPPRTIAATSSVVTGRGRGRRGRGRGRGRGVTGCVEKGTSNTRGGMRSRARGRGGGRGLRSKAAGAIKTLTEKYLQVSAVLLYVLLQWWLRSAATSECCIAVVVEVCCY